jgi:hypothetical protein
LFPGFLTFLSAFLLTFFAAIPFIDRSREGQGVWFGTKYSVRLTIITAIYATVVSFGLVVFDAGDRALHTERLTRWIPACEAEVAHAGLPCLRDDIGAEHQGIVTTKDIAKRLEFSIAVPQIKGRPSDGNLDWPRDFSHIPWPLNDWDFKLGMLHGWGGEHVNLPSAVAEQVIPVSSIVFFTLLIIYVLFRMGWVRTRRDVFIVMFTGVMAGYLALTLVGSFFRGEGQALIPPWDIKVDEG